MAEGASACSTFAEIRGRSESRAVSTVIGRFQVANVRLGSLQSAFTTRDKPRDGLPLSSSTEQLEIEPGRLNARKVATLTKPGRHADGGNLYLYISKAGARSWVFMFERAGRQREMGLGPVRDVPLSRARQLAAEARRQLAEGLDPLIERRRKTQTRSFGEVADAYVEAMKPQWSNPKHIAQWTMTLTVHAAALRAVPVGEVSTDAVMDVLKPLWSKLPETASRLRGRIESVLDAAKAQGLRSGENPARWRGHLDQLLPRRPKLSRGHHKALPFDKVPSFMARLRQADSLSALALEFTILTAARTSETIGARWDELDLKGRTWVVPAVRMKAKRPHRVPLSPDALAIVERLTSLRIGPFVFPGTKAERHLSNMALLEMLKGMGVDSTTHGFRSAFRDWVSELTNFPGDLAEAALAHIVKDKTEAAYRRGDLFEKRRALMEAWAKFCRGHAP